MIDYGCDLMACFHPLQGWRSRNGFNKKTGKWSITFSRSNAYIDMPVTIPCGQCIGCRLERSRQWAVRCCHEAVLHKKNCFITLTFNNDSLAKIAPDGSLEKKEFVKFMKRLRKYCDHSGCGKIRFFHCGEYGSKLKRPHHHAIIFGFDFPDKKFLKVKGGFPYYTSDLLSELWPYGYNVIGNVTFESCAYVARYICKKVNGDLADDYYKGLRPEYVTMSRRPGIGKDFYDKYSTSIYPNDKIVIRNNIITKPPRYYDKLLEIEDSELYAKVKASRVKHSKEMVDYDCLKMQEAIQELKLNKLVRSYEGQVLSKESGVEMVLRLYSVFDEKASSFGSPFYLETDGMALRLFSDQVTDSSHPSLLNQHPEDFKLYCIGQFDNDSGEVIKESQPRFLANGSDFIEVNK